VEIATPAAESPVVAAAALFAASLVTGWSLGGLVRARGAV